MFYWVVVGGAEGKVRAAGPRFIRPRPGTEDVALFSFLFIYFQLPDHNVPHHHRKALMLYYVNSPNTPLRRVQHSHTCPYTYKYTSLDHPLFSFKPPTLLPSTAENKLSLL